VAAKGGLGMGSMLPFSSDTDEEDEEPGVQLMAAAARVYEVMRLPPPLRPQTHNPANQAMGTMMGAAPAVMEALRRCMTLPRLQQAVTNWSRML
jgi:hypothetical protein